MASSPIVWRWTPSAPDSPNSRPRSINTWLRRDETPWKSSSSVSAGSSWSSRTRACSASTSSSASPGVERPVGRRASGRVRPGGHRHRGGHLRSHVLLVAFEHGVAVALGVQDPRVAERVARQAAQHVGVPGRDLDQPVGVQRALHVDPAHRRCQLAREQVDDVVALRVVRPAGQVRDPAVQVRGRDRRRLQLRAERLDGGVRTDEWNGTSMPGRIRARLPRRSSACAVPAIAYWRPGALWLTTSTSVAEIGDVLDDRHPVGRDAVGVARYVCLHQLAAAVDERQRVLERERAERVQRGELADAVPGGAEVLADRALGSELGQLRGGQRDQRRLRELGAEEHAERVPLDAAVGQPQLARVAFDDVDQGEPELRAGVASAQSHTARAALDRDRPSAPSPWRWMPWPGKTSAVGGGATIASPSATSVSPTLTRTCTTRRPSTHRHARGLEVEQRAELHRREERHPPVAQQRRVAAAERVDDERPGPRRGPRAVHDRPPQPRHPRGQHRAVQRVAVAADAGERLHRRGRRILGGGEDARRPRAPLRRRRGASAAVSGCRRRIRRRAALRLPPGALDRAARAPARLAGARNLEPRLRVQHVAGGDVGEPRRERFRGRDLDVVEIAAAGARTRSPGRRRGSPARPRRRRSCRAARSGGRGSAGGSARRPGRPARPAARDACPRSPGRGGHASPGLTACDACTSSGSRAASAGTASRPVSAGHASVSARSTGTPSCAAPVAARYARGRPAGHDQVGRQAAAKRIVRRVLGAERARRRTARARRVAADLDATARVARSA